MLSLARNKISEFSPVDSTEAMLELQDLNLAYNQIKCIKSSHLYSKLEELNLTGNPISLMYPEAFAPLKELKMLIMDKCAFKYPARDMLFLKKVETTLTKLSLNKSFVNKNLESTELLEFLKMPELDSLFLQDVGLLNLKKIDKICPNTAILDLQKNRIFTIEAVEILHALPYLAEVNFNDNPICAHKHLQQMVTDVVPNIEVVN